MVSSQQWLTANSGKQPNLANSQEWSRVNSSMTPINAKYGGALSQK